MSVQLCGVHGFVDYESVAKQDLVCQLLTSHDMSLTGFTPYSVLCWRGSLEREEKPPLPIFAGLRPRRVLGEG